MMDRASDFLVRRRIHLLIATIIIAVICAIAFPFVSVNSDMTKYLPDGSQMKQGVDIIAQEFPDLMAMNASTVKVMFRDLPDDEKMKRKEDLGTIEFVDSVSFTKGDATCERNGYSLYTLSTSYSYSSGELKSITRELSEHFDDYGMQYIYGSSAENALPGWIVAAALVMILIILFITCASWFEPALLIITIGLAVLINMGSNILLGEVSSTTYMIASLLQLILSMDYSIILMNRYRQELKLHTSPNPSAISLTDATQAMTKAIRLAFSSVTSSALTTIVGLLALCFMQFKIGIDMGIVLAKGVLISCICIFTVLPALIILTRNILLKTAKPVPAPRFNLLSRFESRTRFVILGMFVVVVIGAFILKGNTKICFTLVEDSKITDIFPPSSQIMLVADRADEEAMVALSDELASNEHVRSSFSWAGTIEKQYTPDELQKMINSLSLLMPQADIPAEYQALIPQALSLIYGANNRETMNIPELLDKVSDGLLDSPLLSMLVTDSIRTDIADAQVMMGETEHMLRSDDHCLLILLTDLPDESSETSAFLDTVDEYCRNHFSGQYSLVGNAPMAWEFEGTFNDELNRITLITAAAIFVVVLFTFRNFLIPLLLVLMIQSAVYATMIIIHLQGYSIYYLALLMVQSILMGALIDYAILFTNYYRENRRSADIQSAIELSYERSIPTIMTSGLIIVIITAVLGYAFPNPTVGQICHTISKGAICSIVLIIFILPGVLGALDKLISRQ